MNWTTKLSCLAAHYYTIAYNFHFTDKMEEAAVCSIQIANECVISRLLSMCSLMSLMQCKARAVTPASMATTQKCQPRAVSASRYARACCKNEDEREWHGIPLVVRPWTELREAPLFFWLCVAGPPAKQFCRSPFGRASRGARAAVVGGLPQAPIVL